MDLAGLLAAVVANLSRTQDRVLVGVDGPDAAGKTTLANHLADALEVPTLRASIDGFHQPRRLRYQRGELSAEGYYRDSFDYPSLLGGCLTPFRDGAPRVQTASYDYRADAARLDPRHPGRPGVEQGRPARMVTRRIADVLLRVAARRWPSDLRGELHREWSGELHVLATRGRRAQMLRFAASLTASRPGTPLIHRSLMNRRMRRTAIALLLAPLACVGIFLLSGVIMTVVVGHLLSRVSWSMALQAPLLATLTGTLAVVLAAFAARWARHTALTGPLRTNRR